MHDLYLHRLSSRATGSSKLIPRQRARRKAWLSKTSTYNSGPYFFFPASQYPEVKTYEFRSRWTRLRNIVQRLSITISQGNRTLTEVAEKSNNTGQTWDLSHHLLPSDAASPPGIRQNDVSPRICDEIFLRSVVNSLVVRPGFIKKTSQTVF